MGCCLFFAEFLHMSVCRSIKSLIIGKYWCNFISKFISTKWDEGNDYLYEEHSLYIHTGYFSATNSRVEVWIQRLTPAMPALRVQRVNGLPGTRPCTLPWFPSETVMRITRAITTRRGYVSLMSYVGSLVCRRSSATSTSNSAIRGVCNNLSFVVEADDDAAGETV